MPLTTADFLLVQQPPLLTDEVYVGLSTDTKPTVAEDGGDLQLGTQFVCEDTGVAWYWTGSAWAGTTFGQQQRLQIDLLTEIRDLLRSQAEEEDE